MNIAMQQNVEKKNCCWFVCFNPDCPESIHEYVCTTCLDLHHNNINERFLVNFLICGSCYDDARNRHIKAKQRNQAKQRKIRKRRFV